MNSKSSFLPGFSALKEPYPVATSVDHQACVLSKLITLIFITMDGATLFIASLLFLSLYSLLFSRFIWVRVLNSHLLFSVFSTFYYVSLQIILCIFYVKNYVWSRPV